MFDIDYPGHYMRRIRNISVTIPCVAGPYTGVHCRLQMLSGITRVDPRLRDPITPCCGDKHKSCCPKLGSRAGSRCQCKHPGHGPPAGAYAPEPHDPRFIRHYAATESIATSSGQNDTGLFELNFRDDRYLPFEYAGAVSRWRIELPLDNNQFDFDTISDFVLHLNYTAREGGEMLREAANREAQAILPCAGVRYFDIRHDLPDAWRAFRPNPPLAPPHRDFPLRFTRSMFPFVTNRREVRITRLEIFLESPCALEGEHFRVAFEPGRAQALADKPKKQGGDCCATGKRAFTCVVAAEWPGLYHGVLDVELGPVAHGAASATVPELGRLRFPYDLAPVEEVYLLCRYTICEEPCPPRSTAGPSALVRCEPGEGKGKGYGWGHHVGHAGHRGPGWHHEGYGKPEGLERNGWSKGPEGKGEGEREWKGPIPWRGREGWIR